MNLRLLCALPLLIFACACSTAGKATFEVEVMNISTSTIYVGFTKNGPPLEDGWAAPQDVPPQFMDRHWGIPVKPGETKTLGPIEGHFARNVMAVFRVYAGDNPTVEQLLAYGKNDPDRIDIFLWPGKNKFTVNNPGKGKLSYTVDDNKAPIPSK